VIHGFSLDIVVVIKAVCLVLLFHDLLTGHALHLVDWALFVVDAASLLARILIVRFFAKIVIFRVIGLKLLVVQQVAEKRVNIVQGHPHAEQIVHLHVHAVILDFIELAWV
jgi:hypothetical protein